MAIWHDRKLNNDTLNTQYKNFPAFFSLQKIGNANLGLLPSPFPCGSLHSYSANTAKIQLALDGTIDNAFALGASLGLSCSSVADTICALYLLKGPEGLYLLEGDASIILYDASKRHTVLHRLFVTGWPLYFAVKNNRLSVSTNPIYLLRRDDISDSLNTIEISKLFAINPLSWKMDFFSDIESLGHGELIIISAQGINRKKRRLEGIFHKTHGILSDQAAFQQYRVLLESAVRKSLKPNKKYGIMLSSGMDSSPLALYAAKILQAQGRELVAYSWTLPNDGADESEKIKKICHHLNIPLTIFNGELFGPFDQLDQPFLLPDSPFVNLFWPLNQECYRLAAEDGVDYLLNGNYADLLFVDKEKQLTSAWHNKRFDLLIPIIKDTIKKQGINRLIRSSIKWLSQHNRKEQIPAMPWTTEKTSHILNKTQTILPVEGFENFRFALSPFHTGYLGGERYLSALHHLQRIEPHKNIALMNFSLTIPPYLSYRYGQTKYFVRKAMQGLLPDEVIQQARVGLLSSFAIKSFHRNRQKVCEKVFANKTSWSPYIKESWILEKLQDNTEVNNTDIYIIWLCIHLGAWQKAIQPGGVLYEQS